MTEPNTIMMSPVGWVRSTRKKVMDDDWDREKVFIELDSTRFGNDSILGLDDFSHVEIIFYMDQVEADKIELAARKPRNNPDWPDVGIFAQRGKNRPNQIGTTICKILKVDGSRLHVFGLDAVDGTPVLDIKPWVKEFGPRGNIFQPNWVTELMTEYWVPKK